MELLFGLSATFLTGLVLGYLLATHIHSIANAAAARISTIGGSAVLSTVEPVAKE